MDGFARSRIDNPAIAKLHELTVQEAERIGGLGLEAMRLFQGQIFGEPVMMTLDDVAKRLGLSQDAVSDAIRPINTAAVERWKTTDEFQQWRSPENFSYANFSPQALERLTAANDIALGDGAEALLPGHLRAALDAPHAATQPRGDFMRIKFDATLVTALRRAHAAAVTAGENVEPRHLNDALRHTSPPAA